MPTKFTNHRRDYMAGPSAYQSGDTACTYQHIQGVFLARLNRLKVELHLTATEYCLMGFLIGLYNKNQQKGLPFL